MLFGKSERKKTSACTVLVVGALAMLGAAGVVHKSKKLFGTVCDKMKNMMKKAPCDIC